MKLREEIESYLATFHEGSDQQRYHLENFMRWREAQSNKGNCQLEPLVEKELDDFKATHPDAHPLEVAMSVARIVMRKSNEQNMLRLRELFGGSDGKD